MYLQRVDRNPSEYNPYALKVVPFSDINPEDFFTLSVNGITFYRNRISEDFTDLVRWERELRLFKDLKGLHLWKHFRMWKVLFLEGMLPAQHCRGLHLVTRSHCTRTTTSALRSHCVLPRAHVQGGKVL